LIENGEERSIVMPNADGTASMVQAHFVAGTGWIDNQNGQTVLGLKDWQVQTDAHNAHLQPGPGADNDYQPGTSNGEAEAAGYLASQNSGTPANEKPANDSSAIYDQLVDAFSNSTSNTGLTSPGVQYADAANATGNSGVVSDAGGGGTGNSASNQPLAPTEYAPAAPETIASTNPSPAPASSTQFVQYGSQYNAALQPFNAALNLLQGLNSLQHWDKMDDLGHFNSLLSLANSINTLSDDALVGVLRNVTCTGLKSSQDIHPFTINFRKAVNDCCFLVCA
jgi:hypothetical protein